MGNEQLDFDCGEALQNDERLLAALGIRKSQTFFKTALKARKHKNPVLLLVLTNPDDQLQIDRCIQIFAESSPLIQDMLNTQYDLMVVSMEQLET